jgi:hypothetical protein
MGVIHACMKHKDVVRDLRDDLGTTSERLKSVNELCDQQAFQITKLERCNRELIKHYNDVKKQFTTDMAGMVNHVMTRGPLRKGCLDEEFERLYIERVLTYVYIRYLEHITDVTGNILFLKGVSDDG